MSGPRHIVRVCKGLSCESRFSDDLYSLAKQRANGSGTVAVESCTCQNLCERGPNVFIDRVIYNEVTTEQISELLDRVLSTGPG